MLEFREIKITRDSKHLYVDAAVKDGQWYDNVYIDGVMIDKAENYVNNGPSSHAVNIKLDNSINTKRHFFDISPQDIGETSFDGMYFVYVYTKGLPSMDVPCGKDVNMILLPVYNTYPLYQYSMKFIRQVSKSCCIPKDFIDCILRIRALETSMLTGNYENAIMYFNLFKVKGSNQSIIKGGCGCGK